MSDDPDHVRRWLLNAGGAAIVSSAMGAQAQGAAVPAVKAAADPDEPAADGPPSPVTIALTEYVAGALDRDMPAEVVEKTKLHTLDTIAAMVSGSRLKAGVMAAKYVDSLGGKPQATVIGTQIITSSVNAALANGMAAHGDETDDSHLRGRFHPGCGIVPAALATRRTRRTQRQRFAARGGARLRHRSAAHLFARLRQALYRAPQYPYARHHLRGGGGGVRHAAARSDGRAPRVLVRGPAGLRRAILGARPRACGKSLRFRRHGCPQRRHRRHHDRHGVHGSRRLHQRHREHVHRNRRREAAAGRAHGRARQALRGHEHLDQEMDGRLAAAIGAGRRHRDAGGPGRARRQGQAHRGRDAGGPAAHRGQPHHLGHLACSTSSP